ncbi:MAG: o-succinylbenzoate--CoA ligase [Cellulomonas sp.]|nr:o-succinylbenzoate--CoA ligase [Cellulomonas sp.]
MSRPLHVVPAENLRRALPSALDGTGPALAVSSGKTVDSAAPTTTPNTAPTTVPNAVPDTVPDDVAVVVRTSGSTGDPRDVMLTSAALLASARASADRLGGTGTWLLTLPVAHVAGLQVLVRSHLAGTTPVALPPGPFRAEGFTAAARRLAGPSYCSLVPTQLVRLLDDPEATEALASFAAVLVGGAGAPDNLLARAAAAGVHVVTTYGATETCGGAVYDGRPLDGVETALTDDGRITLTGPVLARGYLGRPDLDAQVLPLRAGRRWFVTSDLGRLTADGRLEVLGRADDVLVTGGTKVAPLAVERVIAGCPGVREALVVGVPDPHWGQAVTVLVVPTDDGPPTLAGLRAHVADRLGAAAAPRHLVLLDALPLLGSGKPDRRSATALAARSSGTTDTTTEVNRGDSS